MDRTKTMRLVIFVGTRTENLSVKVKKLMRTESLSVAVRNELNFLNVNSFKLFFDNLDETKCAGNENDKQNVVKLTYYVKVKVNQSRYRPGVSQKVPGI